MIEDSIIKQILDGWAASPTLPSPGSTQRPLPSFHDAKEVFETVFLASLRREEDRPISFSIVIATPSDIHDPSPRYSREFHPFTTIVPFTIESVTKLAPAFDPALSSIAVYRDPSTSKLRCWGIFDYSPYSPLRNERTRFRPDLFTLTAREPGTIQVSHMDRNVGLFIDGIFHPAVPTPLISRSLGGYLIQSLEATELWQRYNTSYWHIYSRGLEALLSESALWGHGAIIVLLPNKSPAVPEHLISDGYRIELGNPLRACFKEMLETRSVAPQLEIELLNLNSEKAALDSLTRLAHLSTVDGALILTRELELVAFGAKLHAGIWEGETVEGSNRLGNTSRMPFDVRRYGLRHHSALNFAAACEGSCVFVISHDGPVRAFIRVNDTVLYWGHRTASMFIDGA